MPRTTFIYVLLAFCIGACRREPVPAPSMEDVRAEIAPTQESWDVHYFITETDEDEEESRPRLDIRAKYMAAYETEDSTYTVMVSDSVSERVEAHFYDEAGDTSATLHANRLILYEDEDRFEARGNVVVETPEDKRLESEHLVWLEKERQVRTPGFVRIISPKEQVQGYQLIADEDLETYTLNRMTGQVTVEEED